MVAAFDVVDVNSNPARFDQKKADALNAEHIRMLDVVDPTLDWVRLAAGMGVEAACVDTLAAFDDVFAMAMRRRGPFVIEARI